MTDAEIWVLEALRKSLAGNDDADSSEKACKSEADTGAERPGINDIVRILKAHSVTQLAEEELKKAVSESDDPGDMHIYNRILAGNKAATLHAMRQIYLTQKTVNAFESENIQIIVLKGIATARYYGKPEKRKAGDVDILLTDRNRTEDARRIILSLGCDIKEEQRAQHHIVFNYRKTDIDIELHTMLVEPFDNEKINHYVDLLITECGQHMAYVDAFGVRVPALIGAYHAYELLLHMLQHFLRAGFGLKLLCDWVVFWNTEQMDTAEQETYMTLVKESGVKGFSDGITMICTDYLGLKEEKVSFMELQGSRRSINARELLKDILAGEEFGHADSDRMVALRGSRLSDYIREFHHQMKLNHPKTSKAVILWPALWIYTYIVFVHNNRVIRKTGTFDIYKNAGRRGRIVRQMKLFEMQP